MPTRSLWNSNSRQLTVSHSNGVYLLSAGAILDNLYLLAGLLVLMLVTGFFIFGRRKVTETQSAALSAGIIMQGRRLKLPFEMCKKTPIIL